MNPDCVGQLSHHGRPHRCTQPILLLLHLAAQVNKTVIYNRTDAMKTLVYAFVSSRIDYCNSIFAGVSGQQLQMLQSVQNAAARLVTGARRSDRMTPILRQLHWLPVCHRITFKMAVLVYKCRHGIAPPYLSTYCEPT